MNFGIGLSDMREQRLRYRNSENPNCIQQKAIIHMLYRRFLTCVLLNFVSNAGQGCSHLHAYVL